MTTKAIHQQFRLIPTSDFWKLGIWMMTLLLLPLVAQAQMRELRFKTFDISNGLSNNNVTRIIMDKRGYLWVGTSDGLNRFDSYDFRHYRHNSTDLTSIAGNSVRCLFEDSKGFLWVGLRNGWLSKYDPEKDNFFSYNTLETFDSEGDGEVSGIAEDAQGNIWLAVDRKGIVCLNPTDNKRTSYDIKYGFSGSAASSIAVGRDGGIWVTIWGGGLNRFDPKTHRVKQYFNNGSLPEDELPSHLMSQCHDRMGNIWVGTDENGAFCLNPKTNTWKQYTHSADLSKGLRNETVTDIKEDPEGKIWISTNRGGISVFNPRTQSFQQITSKDEEVNSRVQNVNSLYLDTFGSMWIGTRYGVCLHHPLLMNFKCFNLTDLDKGAIDDNVNSVVEDHQGNIFVSGNNALFRINAATGQVERVSLSHFGIDRSSGLILYKDSRKDMWLGTARDYIIHHEASCGKSEKIQLPLGSEGHSPFRSVNVFYEDRDGSIWIGMETGVLNYNPKQKSFHPLYQSGRLIFKNEKTHAFARDSYGDLWVGTEEGLRRYDKTGKAIKTYLSLPPDTNTLSDSYITAICEDKQKNLWVGTREGLNRFDRKKGTFSLVPFTGLDRVAPPVMSIVNDDNGHLWISSTIGIIEYFYQDGTFQLYDENDGLQGKEFNQGVFFKASDGSILFGGTNGLNVFNPQNVRRNTFKPLVFISDFQIFNESVKPGEESVLKNPIETTKRIVLQYWQSMITFQFAANNFLSTERCQYLYKLEGLDKDWIRTTPDKRFATYTNLPAGKYVFRVKAANDNGVWSEEDAQVELVILPPFWKTWWAYIIYALVVIAVVVRAVRSYARNLEEKFRMLNEKNKVIYQRDLNEMKLQFFSGISHEIRTSITLVLGPLEDIIRHHPDSKEMPMLRIMHRNAQRLMQLITQTLDFRKIEAEEMEVIMVHQDIVSFIRIVYDNFKYHAAQKKIEYSFQTTVESLDTDFDRDKMDKILYNLLSNAFKYTDEGGHVTVLVDQITEEGKQWLQVRVKDDGIGIPKTNLEHLFEMFYRVNNNRNSQSGGTGMGLHLTAEFVSMLGGRINVESEENAGSTFIVTLPVASNVKPTKDEVTPMVEYAESLPATEVSETEDDAEKDLILIVEDNYDMRDFIRSILTPQFRVIEAKDGAEGLWKAQEYVPNIIVSDVMMPEMDGMTMLTKIKEIDSINHIPVILLTAISDEENILNSLNSGVDDYITKPFSASLLKARIANILNSRKRMWQRLSAKALSESETPSGQPEIPLEASFTEAEERYVEQYINPFVEKLENIVKNNISDPAFNSDALASQLFMSASNLLRKTKAVMNDTPQSLIIKIRMEEAARRIKESDVPIGNIAFACGYQEVSNFSRAFTKFYGVSPTQYRKSQG